VLPKYNSIEDGNSRDYSSGALTEVGRAYLAWNSRLGVPEDVWVIISTAVLTCDSCLLVRTFAGHKKHCEQNLCNEVSTVEEPQDWIGKLTAQQLQEHGKALLPAAIYPVAKAGLDSSDSLQLSYSTNN